MSVYFVYRSHYGNPTGKFLRRFENDTVLEWFQQHWIAEPDNTRAQELALATLGRNVYTFYRLFTGISEQGLEPPESVAAAVEALDEFMYGGELEHSEHALQRFTDDDELELVVYFFDDHFLRAHPELASYLALADWRLPTKATGPGGFRPNVQAEAPVSGDGEGSVYVTFEDFYASDNLDSLPKVYRIDGVRLPGLCQLLARSEVGDYDRDLGLLKAQMFAGYAPANDDERALFDALRDDPTNSTRWGVYADWLEEHGRRPPGVTLLEHALRGVGAQPVDRHSTNDPQKSLVAASDHVAQVCRHTDADPTGGLYHHWILFDDVWASTHPDLANSILRFASRWDPLTID